MSSQWGLLCSTAPQKSRTVPGRHMIGTGAQQLFDDWIYEEIITKVYLH